MLDMIPDLSPLSVARPLPVKHATRGFAVGASLSTHGLTKISMQLKIVENALTIMSEELHTVKVTLSQHIQKQYHPPSMYRLTGDKRESWTLVMERAKTNLDTRIGYALSRLQNFDSIRFALKQEVDALLYMRHSTDPNHDTSEKNIDFRDDSLEVLGHFEELGREIDVYLKALYRDARFFLIELDPTLPESGKLPSVLVRDMQPVAS